MPDDTHRRTRRELLAGGTALAATAVTGSTAGCLGLLPPLGQEVRYGRVDTPEPVDTTPVYRRWIPAGSELSDVGDSPSVDGLHWVSVTPDRLGLDALGAEFRIGATLVKAQLDYFGYAFQHYKYVHSFGSLGAVAEGNVDGTLVTETLLESGYERDGTHHDWELFDREDIPRRVAVSDGAVVQSNGEHRHEYLETLLDAGDGRIDRRHEREEQFDSFTEWVGSYPTLLEGFGGGFGAFEPEASTMAYTFDDEAAYYIYLQQYADGETPSEGEIQQALEESQERAVRAWSVDIELDGTQVSVQMRFGQDEFNEGGSSAEDRRPYLTWGVEDGDGVVAVRHEAGEPVPVDQLDVEPDGVVVTDLEPGTTIEPGDELTVETGAFPEDDDTLSLFYSYEGVERGKSALLHYTPDDLDTDR